MRTDCTILIEVELNFSEMKFSSLTRVLALSRFVLFVALRNCNFSQPLGVLALCPRDSLYLSSYGPRIDI